MKNGEKIGLWYGVFLSVFTVAVVVLIIAEAAQIYYAGGGYSREIVGEKLRILIAPLILWILAIVGGFVLFVLFGKEPPLRAKGDARKTCRRLEGKIPQGEGAEFLAAKERLRILRIVRLIVWGVAGAFALAVAIVGIVYLADVSHFPASDPTGSVLSLVKNVLIFAVCALALFVGATVYDGISSKRELDCMKRMISLGRGYPVAMPAPKKLRGALAAVAAKENVLVLGARIAVAVLAVVFIAVGVWNGGMHDVFMKAAKICTECIGLG